MAEPSGVVPGGRDPEAEKRTLRQQQRTGGSPFSLLVDESLLRDNADRLAVNASTANSILANQVFGP